MVNRILSLVGWLGMALVVAAIGIRFGMPAKDQYAYYLAWGGLICMLAYMLSQWREIAKMFSRRQARYGTLTGVSILVVLAILIALNYIGKRQNKRWDFTETKVYSLSDQTKNYVGKLDSPLQVMVFDQDSGNFQQYRDRFKEYQYASKQIAVDYIDPDKKREIAQQNQIQQYGTIVLKYKDRTERVTSNTEQDITNGIIKVVTGQQKKIYFTQGHGEKDTTGSDRLGYAGVAAALKNENYSVDKLVIAQKGSIPDDAAVVIIAGPTVDFLSGEVDALKTYLGKAGKLLMMLDPPDKADSAPMTNLIALAHDWGIDVGNNVVIDRSGMGQMLNASPTQPVVASYPSHPITERFNVMTIFPLSRSVTPVSGGVNGHIAQTIAETSEASWSETNLKDLYAGKAELNENQGDKKGPIPLAAAVSAANIEAPKEGAPPEGPKPETRVAVFGDSDFVGQQVLGFAGNRDLFMNTIGWLSQQENLISIRPKEPSDRRLTMTAAQQNNVMFLCLGIPVAVFGTGIYSWWRRR
jgi:ABC-type uncharacterized transport system involved in gliding motility auxiliary subunit